MYISSEFIHEAALAYHRDVNAFWALHVLVQMAFIWRFDQTKHFHAQDGEWFNHIMSQLFTNLIKSLRQTFSHENGSHDHDHIIYIYMCYSLIICCIHIMNLMQHIILRHNILIDFSNGSNPKYGALTQRWSPSHLSNADAEENSWWVMSDDWDLRFTINLFTVMHYNVLVVIYYKI